MTESKPAAADAFLGELSEQGDLLVSFGLARLSEQLPEQAPSEPLRAQILDHARSEDRFARFAPAVAEFLDLELESARALLAQVDDQAAWFQALPGIDFLAADGGPRARGALRAFVRVRAGVEFPEHEHLGGEAVLIMQGHYRDSVDGTVYGPGDVPTHDTATHHSFRVFADGPDLLGLVVAHTGLRALGRDFLSFD
jgi:hypothetical protein